MTCYYQIKDRLPFQKSISTRSRWGSNKELAEEYDFTPVHIANILRADHAQTLIAQAHNKLRTLAIEHPAELLDIQARIREKAQKRVEDFLDNDKAASESPFAFINIIKSFAMVAPANTSERDKSQTLNIQVNNQVNTIQEVSLKNESLDRLSKAMEISSGLLLPDPTSSK